MKPASRSPRAAPTRSSPEGGRGAARLPRRGEVGLHDVAARRDPAGIATCISSDLVVARAVVERDGRVLLVRRSAWDTLPGWWELPGGKVDPRESAESGVIRELAEETGLVATGDPSPAFQLPLRSPSGRRVLERVYRVPTAGDPELSAEHDALVWHDPDDPDPGRLTASAAAVTRSLAAS